MAAENEACAQMIHLTINNIPVEVPIDGLFQL